MNLSEFDFEYPKDLVAQYPSEKRGEVRLLVAHRQTDELLHTSFDHMVDFLYPGDCVVMNQTRVIPARLFGQKESGGVVEVVLLKEISLGLWKCLVRPSKKLKENSKIMFGHKFYATISTPEDDGMPFLTFSWEGSFDENLHKWGHIPLPPYIQRADESIDSERYQTIFAIKPGAVAAPTAGLHWTQKLLMELEAKGITLAPITLHVGYGTFAPIRENRIEAHKMHEEFFEISEESALKINNAVRVIAVGTTIVRALESAVRNGKVVAQSGWTNLFIYSGYSFKRVNVLQTNFHQPRSSLFVMVSAFAGTDFISKCYREAIERKYRLFSYGDTMLIL